MLMLMTVKTWRCWLLPIHEKCFVAVLSTEMEWMGMALLVALCDLMMAMADHDVEMQVALVAEMLVAAMRLELMVCSMAVVFVDLTVCAIRLVAIVAIFRTVLIC